MSRARVFAEIQYHYREIKRLAGEVLTVADYGEDVQRRAHAQKKAPTEILPPGLLFRALARAAIRLAQEKEGKR